MRFCALTLPLWTLSLLLACATRLVFAPPPPTSTAVTSDVRAASDTPTIIIDSHPEFEEPLPELLRSASEEEGVNMSEKKSEEESETVRTTTPASTALGHVFPHLITTSCPSSPSSFKNFSQQFMEKIMAIDETKLSPLERQIVEAIRAKDTDGLVNLLQCVICYEPLGSKNMVCSAFVGFSGDLFV
jgi:hypothetical protein